MTEWQWPQWVYAGLLVLSVLLAMLLDGKPKSGNHSFGTSVGSAMVSAWLLWMGGFWS